MRYLILGAGGQLGKEFTKSLSERRKSTVYAMARTELDVGNLDAVYRTIRELRPNVVINCSAYNKVDQAEEAGFEEAIRVNAFGPRNLAISAKEVRAFLIHFSTDYVFSGEKASPYLEEDSPTPINKYGLSKLLGEREISSILDPDEYVIFRVSWVYGRGENNFLHRLSIWAKSGDLLKVSCDEFSVPTSTKTIVEITLRALEAGLSGMYHLVNSGYASRYEWAQEYFRLLGVKKLIYPVYREEFNLPAKRPRWSVMSNERISKALNLEIKHWKEALRDYLRGSESNG